MAKDTVRGVKTLARDSRSDSALVAATLRADRVQRYKLPGLNWAECWLRI